MPTEPSASPLRPIELLGFTAHAGSRDDYLAHVEASIEAARPTTVLAHNLHSLYLYYRSPELRACYQRSHNMIDGMPVVWLARLLGHAVTRRDRLTYVDFIWPLLTLAERRGWRVCHIGQAPEVQQRALDTVRARLPALELLGIPGYFDHRPDSDGTREVLAQVQDFAPQLLLVGLGSPLQEQWIHRNRAQLHAPAVLSCGACMEYVAGQVGTPPRWMGRAGLEWSYRLWENPGRFAGRYLVEPWGLLYSMLRYRLSGRH